MSQERLSSLSILSIENKTANALRYDLDTIIKMVAKAKVRLKDILKFLHDCYFFTDYNTIILFLFPSYIANICNNNKAIACYKL